MGRAGNLPGADLKVDNKEARAGDHAAAARKADLKEMGRAGDLPVAARVDLKVDNKEDRAGDLPVVVRIKAARRAVVRVGDLPAVVQIKADLPVANLLNSSKSTSAQGIEDRHKNAGGSDGCANQSMHEQVA